MEDNKYVYWLEDLDRDDLFLAGRKCCGLGEMLRSGLPVPPGFAVSLKAYETFIDETGVGRSIRQYFDDNIDRMKEDVGAFEEAGRHIGGLVESQPVPGDIREVILEHYHELGKRCGAPGVSVAIRSSGPVSMPGQFDTFLNINGPEEVLAHVKRVWASSFNARAIAYRMQRGMRVESSPIGVAVLKMVNARSSGVMFTLDPLNGDPSRIFIEGSWGLGESLVSGQVTPDKYTVDKVTLQITRRVICSKKMKMVYGPGGSIQAVDVPPEEVNLPCLEDSEVVQLAKLGKMVERHYGVPQDLEWAVDSDLPPPGNIILLQTRPETVWSRKKAEPVVKPKSSALEHIASTLLAGKKFFPREPDS
ncbi:MAG: PEP/pyruvate-binding domain-containing protein [Bacillota bacterium]